MTGRGRAGACAALLAFFVASLAGVAPVRQAQGQTPRSRLTLSAQTAVVGPGGTFTVRLRVDRSAVPATAELVVTVYGAVQTRSEFVETVRDRMSRGPLVPPSVYPLGTLAPDSAGDVTVNLPVLGPSSDPGQADTGRLDLGLDDNVFPVRVELRERNGPSLDRFTTHLVHVPSSPAGPKLGLSLVVPFSAPTGLPADGPRRVPGLEELAGAAQALEATRGLPFVLAPSPETVASLAAMNDERAVRTVDTLRRMAAEHPVLALPYVPAHVPSLLISGLGQELSYQVARGAEILDEVLQTSPDDRTWLGTEPLDLESIDELVGRRVRRIIAVDDVLEPIPDQSVTLTRPFLLGGANHEIDAVAADRGLGSYFNGSPNQVLQAHHLLADLAVLWLDAPGDDRRAAVAVAPRDWKANRPFLDALSSGLAQNPTTEPMPLDTVFSAVEPALGALGGPLVRNPADPRPAPGLSEVVGVIRQLRRQLTSLATVTGESTGALRLLEERLLIAESSSLPGARQRTDYLDAVETGIADQLESIEMPEGRSITLTARRGQIPVTFQNRTGSPVKVVVSVQSDKLEFPDGDSRPLELTRRNTTERFSVVARTSGAFPLRITLMSPDGNLMVGRARLTVRSTAASRVSLFVSVGALLFLAVWWGRHVVRGRRAGRLVPP